MLSIDVTTHAPAGIGGTGTCRASSWAVPLVDRRPAQVRGSGLPSVDLLGARVRATGAAMPAVEPGTSPCGAIPLGTTPFGTTPLGIHPPGRPRS